MIVVVSDFHLSEGVRPASSRLSPNEDFFFDDAFSRFLIYLRGIQPGGVHLVINGDLFDLLQVGVNEEEINRLGFADEQVLVERKHILKYGLGTGGDQSAFKLGKIWEGHQTFFKALADFIAVGNELTIVSGNHDIELFWPSVQARFLSILEDASATTGNIKEKVERNVHFEPWIFYNKEFGVYAEHGNQYESLNPFPYCLYPVLPKKRDAIALPFGSFLVRYLFNKIENIDPFADNIKPSTRYLSSLLKKNPFDIWRISKILWRFVCSLADIFKRTSKIAVFDSKDEKDFRDETNRQLTDIAGRFEIDGDVSKEEHALRQIMAKHIRPLNDRKSRLLIWVLFSYLDTLLLILALPVLTVLCVSLLKYGIKNVYSAVSFGLTIFGAFAGWFVSLILDRASPKYPDLAQEIIQIMKAGEEPGKYPVKCVTFGHTHEPEIERFQDGTFYFNTGTWNVIFSEEEELIRDKKQFAFLMIKEPGNDPQLLRWNDEIGAPELLLLFDKQ